jgi:hypothetical protein
MNPAAGPGLNQPAREQIAVTIDSMSPDSRAVPDKPVLDGIEDKWSQRWHEARVVQV